MVMGGRFSTVWQVACVRLILFTVFGWRAQEEFRREPGLLLFVNRSGTDPVPAALFRAHGIAAIGRAGEGALQWQGLYPPRSVTGQELINIKGS